MFQLSKYAGFGLESFLLRLDVLYLKASLWDGSTVEPLRFSSDACESKSEKVEINWIKFDEMEFPEWG